jgi:hypothetical protein
MRSAYLMERFVMHFELNAIVGLVHQTTVADEVALMDIALIKGSNYLPINLTN